ncbi:hypothetical protein BDV95DRAFT_556214 [Massariosphaeria phaeospora]|uniref:Rhodopsin domain-containing protein n=1 Tax=Massariosphaeria phaeospora TaxID=100035 RepID=A0A7C8IJE4_9PLEO|nr:hypothetical protein BDV95DRAFT_556214 [Massariosphaeria phaeospora]
MGGDFPNLTLEILSQWPIRNALDPVTRSWFPAYGATLTIVATLVVAARIWSQFKRSTHGLGIDDAVAFAAWTFAVLFTTACLIGVLEFGFDRHLWDVSSTLHSRAALVEWLSEGAFILSTCMTKVSVLCFYRRLETSCSAAFKRIIHFFITLTILFSFACLLTQVLLCHPTSQYWRIPNQTHPIPTCASQHIYYPVQGLLTCMSTVYSIVIPVLVLRNLPMPQFQRTGLRVISVLGLGVLASGVVRTVFLFRLAHSPNGDATWNGFNVFIWAQLECHLALICASLPFLQRYSSLYPSVPIVFANPNGKDRHDSVISRVSSSLSGRIKQLSSGRSNSVRNAPISEPRPPAVEIPEWEFETLESPRRVYASSPVDEFTYERYVLGMYGPPAPPKDSRDVFDQYRRQHGEIV